MKNSRVIIVTVIALVVVGLLVGAFLFFFEPVEKEIKTGYSAEAKRNRFLAAQRFMKQLGIESEIIRGIDKLHNLPAGNDILIATYSHRFEQVKIKDELLEWVNQGGHLILELKPFNRTDDLEVETPFLDELGVKPKRSNTLLRNINRENIEITVYKNSEPLTVSFQPYHTLEVTKEDPVLLYKDSNGTHLVEYYVGAGLVTILSELDLWRNQNIGDHDNAAALAHIVGENPGKVWVLFGVSMPTLFELMWKHGSEAVIALALLLLLWLWAMYNRFGPRVEFNEQQRRSLLEHLDAVGQFEWRYHRANTILGTVRQELHQLIETRYPRWQKKSQIEQCEWLAKRTSLPEQDINLALTANSDHQTSFTRYIKILQTIRKTV